jgi:hypothetical protein
MRALVQRINRKLARDEGQQLRAARTYTTDTGNYFIVDCVGGRGGFIVCGHVDPAKLARELGVLRAWEAVAQ